MKLTVLDESMHYHALFDYGNDVPLCLMWAFGERYSSEREP